MDTMSMFINIEMSKDSMVYTRDRISFNLENKRKHSTCDVILFFENKSLNQLSLKGVKELSSISCREEYLHTYIYNYSKRNTVLLESLCKM